MFYICPGLLEIETWVDWLKRTTREAEAKLEDLNMRQWTTSIRQQKWRWAGKVAQMEDSRWAKILATWLPGRDAPTTRNPGRQLLRWSDDITRFLVNFGITEDWMEVAQNAELWLALEDDYVNACT